jgi:hypothetical protein
MIGRTIVILIMIVNIIVVLVLMPITAIVIVIVIFVIVVVIIINTIIISIITIAIIIMNLTSVVGQLETDKHHDHRYTATCPRPSFCAGCCWPARVIPLCYWDNPAPAECVLT